MSHNTRKINNWRCCRTLLAAVSTHAMKRARSVQIYRQNSQHLPWHIGADGLTLIPSRDTLIVMLILWEKGKTSRKKVEVRSPFHTTDKGYTDVVGSYYNHPRGGGNGVNPPNKNFSASIQSKYPKPSAPSVVRSIRHRHFLQQSCVLTHFVCPRQAS